MSMTREEAIKYGENKLTLLRALGYNNYYTPGEYAGYYDEFSFVTAALSALRGPTREQVEKVSGKFFQAGIDDVAQDTWRCSRCLVQEFGDIRGINFCPHCGAPMTDKAVDMVMERLEVMKDGNSVKG